MKFTVNLDCTPEEARDFLGLPDVKPMQDRLLQEVQERMLENVRAMQPEKMLSLWLPASVKGFEQMQELFTQMARPRRE